MSFARPLTLPLSGCLRASSSSNPRRFCRWQCSSSQESAPLHGALENVRVVVVGSQHAGNVGSICRAAANFECRDICLVNPLCDHLSTEGFNAAANPVSRDLLQHVHVQKSLSEAFENCSMAVAFTRRTGKIRHQSYCLEDLKAPKNGNLKLALVFGREDHGLYTDELLQCTHVCRISSGKWEGSLNVSHAVAVVLYNLYEAFEKEQNHSLDTIPQHSMVYKTLPGTASITEVENLLQRWEQVFMLCNQLAISGGKPEFKTPERLFMFLRKLLQRARPSIREIAYLQGFVTLLDNLAKTLK